MTKLAMLPFFSQQDKATGKFLLASCVATKHCMYLADKITKELGWGVRLIVPQFNNVQSWPEGLNGLFERNFMIYQAPIPPDNFAQRLEWYPHKWHEIIGSCDILYTSHELIGWAMKGWRPDLKLVQMHYLTPGTAWPWMNPLFQLNYRAADRLVCLSETMRTNIERDLRDNSKGPYPPVNTWPFSCNTERLAMGKPPERDIDLLFVLRGSSTNYSHHTEFFQALDILRERGWDKTVGFTDYTHYLQTSGYFDGTRGKIEVLKNPQDQNAYINFLYRSKAVIGLCDNGYGGESIREAVYCGAFPILLDCLGYQWLVGRHWPGLVMGVDPLTIADMIEEVFKNELWASVELSRADYVSNRLQQESYAYVWEHKVKPDLLSLV